MIHRFHAGQRSWNDALMVAVLQEQSAKAGSRLGVARGASWSGPKRFERHPSTEGLIGLFRLALRDVAGSEAWDLTLWANVTHQGGSCGLHDHADGCNVWSGVYYLTKGAAIVFPALGLSVEPEPGLLLIFPAGLAHRVCPQVSSAPRISVAMNARS